MAKETITRNEYLQLEGLRALANKHYAIVTDCEAAMNTIIGAPQDDYAASDVAYGDRDIAWLLESQKITVVD